MPIYDGARSIFLVMRLVSAPLRTSNSPVFSNRFILYDISLYGCVSTASVSYYCSLAETKINGNMAARYIAVVERNDATAISTFSLYMRHVSTAFIAVGAVASTSIDVRRTWSSKKIRASRQITAGVRRNLNGINDNTLS